MKVRDSITHALKTEHLENYEMVIVSVGLWRHK